MIKLDKQALVKRYIEAYNTFDIKTMLTLVHPHIQLETISKDKVYATISGVKELIRSVHQAKEIFSRREQVITSCKIEGDQVIIEAYCQGTLAKDASNDLKKGNTFRLSGRLEFTLQYGKIIRIKFFPVCSTTIPYCVDGDIVLVNYDTEEELTHDLSGVLYINPFPSYEYHGEYNNIESANYKIEDFYMEFDRFIFYGSGTIYMTCADIYINLNGSGDYEHILFTDEIDCSRFGFFLQKELPRTFHAADTEIGPFLTGTNIVMGCFGIELTAMCTHLHLFLNLL